MRTISGATRGQLRGLLVGLWVGVGGGGAVTAVVAASVWQRIARATSQGVMSDAVRSGSWLLEFCWCCLVVLLMVAWVGWAAWLRPASRWSWVASLLPVVHVIGVARQLRPRRAAPVVIMWVTCAGAATMLAAGRIVLWLMSAKSSERALGMADKALTGEVHRSIVGLGGYGGSLALDLLGAVALAVLAMMTVAVVGGWGRRDQGERSELAEFSELTGTR